MARHALDLRAIFKDTDEYAGQVQEAFHAYDTEQLVHVSLPDTPCPVILSPFNALPAGPGQFKFYDARSQSTFHYDHVNQVREILYFIPKWKCNSKNFVLKKWATDGLGCGAQHGAADRRRRKLTVNVVSCRHFVNSRD
jgi:hypothetical protein